jgi:hypothetical protein
LNEPIEREATLLKVDATDRPHDLAQRFDDQQFLEFAL